MSYYETQERERIDGLGSLGDPGVPSPLAVHVHPYPTRYHGPIYTRPVFGMPWQRQSHAVFQPWQLRGIGSAAESGDGLFRTSPTAGGGVFNDALEGDASGAIAGAVPVVVFLGAALAGYLIFSKREQVVDAAKGVLGR